MSTGRRTYTTEDEIFFIRGLGSHGSGLNKNDLLKLYTDNLHKRKNWGDVSLTKVFQYLDTGAYK